MVVQEKGCLILRVVQIGLEFEPRAVHLEIGLNLSLVSGW